MLFVDDDVTLLLSRGSVGAEVYGCILSMSKVVARWPSSLLVHGERLLSNRRQQRIASVYTHETLTIVSVKCWQA